jgi:RNA polymerase sigma-70 factor (ECF subfamily)
VFFIPPGCLPGKTGSGEIILYEQQDETLWDQELISLGAYYLHRASQGDSLSKISH